MPPKTPARKALDVALATAKRLIGRPMQTWLDTIKKVLEQSNIFINLKDKQKRIETLINLSRNKKRELMR